MQERGQSRRLRLLGDSDPDVQQSGERLPCQHSNHIPIL